MVTLVVNAGFDIITNRLISAGTEPSFTAWGSGGTAPNAATTILSTEESEARQTNAGTRVTTTATNDTYQNIGTLTADGSKTITNAGLFDAVSAGNLFMTGDFANIGLSLNDSIQFTFQVAFS